MDRESLDLAYWLLHSEHSVHSALDTAFGSGVGTQHSGPLEVEPSRVCSGVDLQDGAGCRGAPLVCRPESGPEGGRAAREAGRKCG